MITISGEAWQWLMVGLDAVMLYGLKRWYHGKVRSAEEIEVSYLTVFFFFFLTPLMHN